MNKKLGRLLQPNMGSYLALMFVFVAASALFQNYILAAIELVLTLGALAIYFLMRVNRHKRLREYLHDQLDGITESHGGKAPFPLLVVRMSDEGIVYANEEFVNLTGFHDRMSERCVADVLPGFSTQWLSNGNREYAYDVTLQNRRYRVYGSMIRADEHNPMSLGVLYFTDLTELYQIRDEYIRSRPVVSIILVDNYEELTKNLSEGAISALDARINDCINQWCGDYHGLLRRLEKNRFLLVFEKRDLRMAKEGKFSLLEDIHEITSPSGVATSISFGLGVDADTSPYDDDIPF